MSTRMKRIDMLQHVVDFGSDITSTCVYAYMCREGKKSKITCDCDLRAILCRIVFRWEGGAGLGLLKSDGKHTD